MNCWFCSHCDVTRKVRIGLRRPTGRGIVGHGGYVEYATRDVEIPCCQTCARTHFRVRLMRFGLSILLITAWLVFVFLWGENAPQKRLWTPLEGVVLGGDVEVHHVASNKDVGESLIGGRPLFLSHRPHIFAEDSHVAIANYVGPDDLGRMVEVHVQGERTGLVIVGVVQGHHISELGVGLVSLAVAAVIWLVLNLWLERLILRKKRKPFGSFRDFPQVENLLTLGWKVSSKVTW